jgi:hypothetical protein
MKIIAEVWITPEGSKQELGSPIVFRLPYSKQFVRNYAHACVGKGQKARIVWKGKKS